MSDTRSEDDDRVFNRYLELVETIPGINYIIDRDYNIVIYSKSKWNDFAEENAGQELVQEKNIIGRSILNSFAGEKVRQYYKKIYDLIFDAKRDEVKITAKCDAPEVLRDNVIFLKPVYKDPIKKKEVIGVLHQSLILKVAARPGKNVDLPEHYKNLDSAYFLEICSICKFVLQEENNEHNWVSPETFYQLGGTDDLKIEQSICDDCSSMLNEFM